MQIDAVSNSAATSIFSPGAKPNETKAAPASADPDDPVDISSAGKAASALDAAGSGRFSIADLTAALGDANGDGQITLEELQAHVDQLLATAEKGLWRLSAETGVDLRKVTVRSDGTGKLVVEGNDPNAAKLEAAINEDPEVRDALIAAQSTSNFIRIASAAGMAQNAANANPSGADGYYAWVRSVAEQTKAMDMVFSVSGGHLNAAYETADGRLIGTSEGIRESARSAGLPASAIG